MFIVTVFCFLAATINLGALVAVLTILVRSVLINHLDIAITNVKVERVNSIINWGQIMVRRQLPLG
jgi:hypothetical protein